MEVIDEENKSKEERVTNKEVWCDILTILHGHSPYLLLLLSLVCFRNHYRLYSCFSGCFFFPLCLFTTYSASLIGLWLG